jgi:His/Glu/Gln/Arg/opine family amino acid ABC transporter permease subunit
MIGQFSPLVADFLPSFLRGMAVNFEIAVIALVIGLVLGLLLALARHRGGLARGTAASVVALMRAAPTFVVMFFLLNALPRDMTLFGAPVVLSGVMAVALSLVPYSAAYVSDAGLDALRHWHDGSHLGALLFLPNVTRAFFVLVMSSSAGAAIGVTEGITVILRRAEQLPSLDERLLLFALGIVMFGIPLQLGFAIVSRIQRRLSRLGDPAQRAAVVEAP